MNVPSWPPPRDLPHRTVRFTGRVIQGMFEHSALDHAASMSFYFFLGLVPLLVGAGYLLASSIDSFEHLALTLLQLAPPTVADLIASQLRSIAGQPSRGVAPLSLLGFLILTSNGIHNLMDVLELVTRAPHRPWWKQRLMAIVSVLGLLEVGIATSWLIVKLNAALGAGPSPHASGLMVAYDTARRLAASTWHQLGALLVCAALLAGGLAAFYRYGISHPPRVKRRVWPGAFVAIGCWVLFSWGFTAYVTRIGQYAVYYGSLATVATLMVWFYLTSLSVLLGAEVNAQLEGMRQPYPSKLRPRKPLAGYQLRPGQRADLTPGFSPLPSEVLATPLPGDVSATPLPLEPVTFSTPPPPPTTPAEGSALDLRRRGRSTS